MKPTLLALIGFLALTSCAPDSEVREVPTHSLFVRKGLVYEGNANYPFTGVAVQYYENGLLWQRTTFYNGQPHGPFENYWSNGQLREKYAYSDGKRHGPFESYYEDGQLEEKYAYIDGKRHGPYEQYNSDGKLMKMVTYEYGQRVQ